MSAPSMMSPAWLSSAVRARASRGLRCASLRRSRRIARLSARSSLSRTPAARSCSFSMVARRTSAVSSRSVTTPSPSAAAAANAMPRMPRLSLRVNRSSIRCVTLSPRPSTTMPAMPVQNIVPQPKPRRGTTTASIGTGNCVGSRSGVICTVPRAGLPASAASMTTTPGSSSRKVAGRLCFGRSLIAICLRSGIAAPGQGGCEAARACRRRPVPAWAGGSAGSGNRSCRHASRTGRGKPRH